jgi:hypothetical protein
MWCSLNNQNLKVEKNGDFYTVSFPTLGKRRCAGSSSALPAKMAGSDHRGGKPNKERQSSTKRSVNGSLSCRSPMTLRKAKAKRGWASTSVSGIWRWQVSEPSLCFLKGNDVLTYVDAMLPDGGSLAKPRSWMRSEVQRQRILVDERPQPQDQPSETFNHRLSTNWRIWFAIRRKWLGFALKKSKWNTQAKPVNAVIARNQIEMVSYSDVKSVAIPAMLIWMEPRGDDTPLTLEVVQSRNEQRVLAIQESPAFSTGKDDAGGKTHVSGVGGDT